MPERHEYLPGVPCWIDTRQPDPDAAASFYSGLFGWDVADVMPPDSPGKYLIGRIRGGDVAGIGSQPEGAPPMATWNTYIRVDSADDTAAKVKEAGGSVLTEPFDVGEAGRMAVFSDPEGAVFCVWQPGQNRGAGIVNEHGSLNFNGLSTRDVEGAKRFYGAVFGWQVLEESQMWTLPGYGDHLEELNPGMRQGMQEMGAPAGFEDVVAAINPIADGPQDVRAHWSVTFAVDDAYSAAAKAAELGGKVIVPPFDAPWVRTTVLADPAGATFIANKFVPENKDLPAPAGSPAAAA